MASIHSDNRRADLGRETPLSDLTTPQLPIPSNPREELLDTLLKRLESRPGDERLEERIRELVEQDVREFQIKGEFTVDDIVAEATLGEALYCVSISSDSSYLAVGSQGGITSVFALEDNELSFVGSMKSQQSITSLAFRPHTHQIAIGGHDRKLTVVSLDSNVLSVVGSIDVGDSVNSISYSPDGKHLVFGTGVGEGGAVRIASLEENGMPTQIKKIEVGGNRPAVAFSPDGELLALSGTTLHLYRLPNNPGDELTLLLHVEESASALVFDYDSTTLIAGGALGGGRSIRRLNTEKPSEEAAVTRREYQPVRSLFLSPSGSNLAVVLESPVKSQFGKLLILDAQTLEKVSELTTTRPIKACSFSPRGDLLAVVGENGALWLFGRQA